MNKKDVIIIRGLAVRVAEIATLPVQEEKRILWRKLNGLRPVRPMVMIEEWPWNEMNIDDELTLRCTDPECRGYEQWLRCVLFQWKRFRVDKVVDPFVLVGKAINNTGFGIKCKEEIAVTDPTSAVVGHKFINQFETEDDLQKIKVPQISHDVSETDRRFSVARELFDGLLEVRPWDLYMDFSFWDPISTWMGVEQALYALVDRPDFMHRLLGRMTYGYLSMLDQLEEQGLLCGPQNNIHSTGAYTDELPTPGYNPEKPRTKDIWMASQAQMLSTVSPGMFKEFDVDYTCRICERFGLVYYGCCEPLDGKMNEVRMLPNVRKISMSPWVNKERGAAEIKKDFVYSCKPNPAFVAGSVFNPGQVRADLEEARDACEKYGCPLEITLKDISTVGYHPERIFQWAEIAMQVVGG